MDAPKKIWAWVDDLAGIVGQSEAPETPPNLPAGPNAISPCAEYILASDHARIVAEKDAEIARLHAAARDVVRAYQEENFMRHADMHPASCGCLRCEIDRLGNACGHFEKPSFPPAPPSKETAMSEAERDAQIEEGTW